MKLSEIYTNEMLQLPIISIDSSREEVCFIDGNELGAKYVLDEITPQIAAAYAFYIRNEDVGEPDADNWEEFLKQYNP